MPRARRSAAWRASRCLCQRLKRPGKHARQSAHAGTSYARHMSSHATSLEAARGPSKHARAPCCGGVGILGRGPPHSCAGERLPQCMRRLRHSWWRWLRGRVTMVYVHIHLCPGENYPWDPSLRSLEWVAFFPLECLCNEAAGGLSGHYCLQSTSRSGAHASLAVLRHEPADQ